jgi:hypothetical protein
MVTFSKIMYVVLSLLLLLSTSAQALTWEFDYNGEPAGDVKRFDENGNVTIVDTFPDLDLKKFETKNGTGDNLTFVLGTKSKSITSSGDVKYVFRIFTEADNETGYNITFLNGMIELVEIVDGIETSSEDITSLGGIIKVKNEDLLELNLPKNKYLPEAELDYLAVDAFTWKEEGNYTYIDYIHNVPGNPGTIAPDITDDPSLSDDGDEKGDNSNRTLIAVVLIIVVLFVVTLLYFSRRKNS